jgi:hypothetical protein
MADLCINRDFVIVILIIVSLYFLFSFNKESFGNLTENYVYGNEFGIADNLEYGQSEKAPMFSNNYPTAVAPPSVDFGVNQASPTNVFDDRGFKWTRNAKDANVDVIMDRMSNDALRKDFSQLYMLDPSNQVAQYDIANMPISRSCCPAQYAPPFPAENGAGDNCSFAQLYVANNYSADSTNSNGTGCPCIKPSQAEFYTNRGGNAGIQS